jgi:multiple sugar transport system permease protein
LNVESAISKQVSILAVRLLLNPGLLASILMLLRIFIVVGALMYLNSIWLTAETAFQMRRRVWPWALLALCVPVVPLGVLYRIRRSAMGRVRIEARSIIVFNVLVVIAATMLLPLFWMVSTSLKSLPDALKPGLHFIPERVRWVNYRDLFTLDRTNFNLNYWNSAFISIVVTVGQVLTSAMAGYAFSRLRWRGRDAVFLAYLATLMIPVTVTMLPNFLILRALNWLDTYKALTLPLMFSAYGTFLCRQFMLGIPRDLEEAAMMDGCGHLRIFTHVILPLSTPVLTTLAILTFMGVWRNFVWPLIVTFSEDLWVLPRALYGFQSQFGVEYNYLMAASLLMILPLLALFVAGQRFFMEGIRLGAVKG